jgi:HSP20 family molecular chaperone IbpA
MTKRRNPMDEALTEVMDAWMELMEITGSIPKGSSLKRHVNNPVRDNIGDWEDTNGEITITVEVPGIDKGDIELTVDKHRVAVSAVSEEGEREYSFVKDFKPELNPEEVKAELNNGILDIKIQKAEEAKGKKIDIQ